MGFINSLSEIRKNGKNFKIWDQKEKDKKSQREKLQENKKLSPQEIKALEKKGEVIMNAIDIMDTHSEEVAENVETVIMPVAQLLPMGALISSGYLTEKRILTPSANAINDAYKEFSKSDSGKQLHELIKQIEEYKEANPNKLLKFNTWGSDTKALSKRNLKELASSDDSTIKEIYKKINEIAKELHNKPAIKNAGKKMGLAASIVALATGGTYVLANVLGAKLQVKSSRIARWQSRQDLSDAKYFVEYTDEQVEQAKNNLKNSKKEKGFSLFKKDDFEKRNSFFKTLFGTIKDDKKYNEWKSTYNPEDKKVKRNLTKEELTEAQKEKELIQRITKDINNNAEEYSEDMETASAMLIGGTPFLGAGVGAIINLIINKTGLEESISKKGLKKVIDSLKDENDKKEVQKLFEQIKNNGKKSKSSLSDMMLNLKNTGELFERVFNSADSQSLKGFSKVLNNAKKGFNLALTTKTARNTLIGAIGGVVTGLAGSFIGLKLQKDAARVGRYKAKREIEENPQNFIGYSEEEYKSVQDVKAQKKPLFKKFVEYITFVPRCTMEYFEYKKYSKGKAKEQKELLNELVKTAKVSDKQLEDAKNTQRKLFTTFESVDDKSQEFSESTEAVTEMVAPFVPYIGISIASIPLIIGGVKLAKGGKIKATESITGFLAKHTKFLKGKTATKYADEVGQNLVNIIENHNISKYTPTNEIAKLATLFKENSIDAKALTKDIETCLKNAKGKPNELQSFLEDFANLDFCKNLKTDNAKSIIDVLTSKSMIDKLKSLGVELPENLNETLNKELSKHIGDCNNLSEVILKAINDENVIIPDAKITEFTDKIAERGKNLKQVSEAIKNQNIGKVTNAYIEGQIQNGNWKKILEKAADGMNGTPKVMINSLINSDITNEQAAKIYKNLMTILDNLPKESLAKIMTIAKEEFIKNPDKFMAALNDGSFQKALITKGVVKAGAISSATWTALCFILTFSLEAFFASTQKKAGKLGVMKGLEELQDEKYYANEKTTK